MDFAGLLSDGFLRLQPFSSFVVNCARKGFAVKAGDFIHLLLHGFFLLDALFSVGGLQSF